MSSAAGSPALAAALADAILSTGEQGLPDVVVEEATRTFLNVLGTAIGASHSVAVDSIVRGGVAAASTIPGRMELVDQLTAATAIGTAAHLEDFDDTHLDTVVHPGAAVLGAIFPTAQAVGVTGEDVVRAVALGVEAQLRIALAMNPQHYDEGWHVTGTVGPIGAAVAAALLLQADRAQLAHAIAIASSMTVGHREGFGTMAKPLHAGKAAANGLLAASLAVRGYTGGDTALEGERGYFRVLASSSDTSIVLAGFGTEWEILKNTYKPYPCGIVIHPIIDAALELASTVDSSDISAVRIRCNPLVTELTGNLVPEDGLESKFSAVHAAAAALHFKKAGPMEFRTPAVRNADVQRLRASITLHPDEGLARDACEIEVITFAGTSKKVLTQAARGSMSRPLTDAEIDDKFAALVKESCGGQAARVISAARALREGATSFRALIESLSTLHGGARVED